MGAGVNRPPFPSEHQEQVSVFREAAIRAKSDPRWSMLFAIPNGGKRSIGVAVKMKAEGVKSGVPDMFLPIPVGSYCGMFVELKKRQGGQISSSQREFLRALDPRYCAVVANGAEQAIEKILAYLEGK